MTICTKRVNYVLWNDARQWKKEYTLMYSLNCNRSTKIYVSKQSPLYEKGLIMYMRWCKTVEKHSWQNWKLRNNFVNIFYKR